MIPDIEIFERFMFVSPHPDDSELGCGATMAKFVSMGKNVKLVVVTDGRKGCLKRDVPEEDVAKMRKTEQLEAAMELGIEDVDFLNFEDLGDYTVEDVRKELIKIIREFKPDVVFTVDPFLRYEVHPDHIKVGMGTLQAVLFSSFPLIEPDSFEEVDVKAAAMYFSSHPNKFVCVDEFHERKMSALRKHSSQFSYIWDEMESYLMARARRHGEIAGCELAEGFKVVPRYMLHVIPEVEDV